MILCPLENKAVFKGFAWIQKRPVITQDFGERPWFYKKYGHNGHNGEDYRAPSGTRLFAPHDGYIKTGDQGDIGYGVYVKIRDPQGLRESTVAHMESTAVMDGEFVYAGEFIGFSGNSGDSSGPHVHQTFKRLIKGKSKDVYKWKIADTDNGYNGAIDVSEFTITYKGTLKATSIYS